MQPDEMRDDDNLIPESFTVPQLLIFFGLALPATAAAQALGIGWDVTFGLVAGSALLAGLAPLGIGMLRPYLPQLSGRDIRSALLAPVAREEQPTEVEGSIIQQDAAPFADETVADSRHSTLLHLGATCRPEADAMLSRRIGLFGIPGSGKSNGVCVFLEELGKLAGVGVPFLLCDTEGEYEALCTDAFLMRPYRAGAHNLSEGQAFQFGQLILDQGLQVILDLQSYEDDNQAALVMIDVIAGMRAWSESRGNDERATCMIILDEASIWLPQRENESVLSKERDEHGLTLLARLQQAFFGTVVRRGRKRGIGFLFAAQRIAEIDKRCMQCDWLILFRQTLTNDIKRYEEMGVDGDLAAALAPGEAFVIDPAGNKAAHQFRPRRSPDQSRTPGLSSLARYASIQPDVQLPAPSATMEPLAPNPKRLPALYQKALDCYRPGMGYRQLAELIGVGKDKAGEVIKDLKKRGLIADEVSSSSASSDVSDASGALYQHEDDRSDDADDDGGAQ